MSFLHRTIREFLQSTFQGHETFKQIFADMSPGLLYGKLTLAQLIYKCPGGLKYDYRYELKFLQERMEKLSPAIYRPSQTQYHLPAFLSKALSSAASTNRMLHDCGNCQHCPRATLSFLHLAANTGHEEYVLSELAVDPNCQGEHNLFSLELSALDGGHSNLGSKILMRGRSIHRHIALHVEKLLEYGYSPDPCLPTVPTWLLIMRDIMEIFFRNNTSDLEYFNYDRLNCLLDFARAHIVSTINMEDCYIIIRQNGSEISISLANLLRTLAAITSAQDDFERRRAGTGSEAVKDTLASIVQTMPSSSFLPPDKFVKDVLESNTRNAFVEVKCDEYSVSTDWCYMIY